MSIDPLGLEQAIRDATNNQPILIAFLLLLILLLQHAPTKGAGATLGQNLLSGEKPIRLFQVDEEMRSAPCPDFFFGWKGANQFHSKYTEKLERGRDLS